MADEIIKVIDALSQKFGVVIDWSSQNVTPYIQNLMERFIKYQNIKAIMWIIISLIFIIVPSIVMVKTIKWYKKGNYNDYDDESVPYFIVNTICPILILVFFIVMMANIFGIAKNICAPELTILEYIQRNFTFVGA